MNGREIQEQQYLLFPIFITYWKSQWGVVWTWTPQPFCLLLKWLQYPAFSPSQWQVSSTLPKSPTRLAEDQVTMIYSHWLVLSKARVTFQNKTKHSGALNLHSCFSEHLSILISGYCFSYNCVSWFKQMCELNRVFIRSFNILEGSINLNKSRVDTYTYLLALFISDEGWWQSFHTSTGQHNKD